MAESKTARASRIVIGEVKKDPFDTPEKKIAELRKQRDAKLAVVRYDFIDALLVEYDKVQLLLAQEIANVVVRNELIEQLTKTGVVLAESTTALLKRAETAEESIAALNDTIQILSAENSQLVEQRDALAAEKQ